MTDAQSMYYSVYPYSNYIFCNNHFPEPKVLTPVPEVDSLNTPIMLYDVRCTGTEPNLSECLKCTSVEYCSHINDAGANCTREIGEQVIAYQLEYCASLL